MKVATLWFERTLHSSCWTPKISAGTSIFMSCLTFTWQESRQPSRASPRLMCPVSVGSMAPPPSSTSTLQTPQVPSPPQAEGMKISLVRQRAEQRAAGRDLHRQVRIVVDGDRHVARLHEATLGDEHHAPPARG